MSQPVGILGELGLPIYLWVTIRLAWTTFAILVSFKLHKQAGWPFFAFVTLWCLLSILFNSICLSGIFLREILMSLMAGFAILVCHSVVALLRKGEQESQIQRWAVFVPLVLNLAIFAGSFSIGGYSDVIN